MDQVAESLLPGRQARFGYVCHRCSRCCHDKKIQLNPYEVARLARNRGQTTTQFRATWTVGGAGTVLEQTETGACVFLGPDGCTVHADRPLVCRLYPLGRHLTLGEDEQFSRLEPHPLSEGEYSDEGTIAAFLESQEADLFIQAADGYLHWFDTALHALAGDLGTTPSTIVAMPPEDHGRLLDMDAAIAEYSASTGGKEPTDIEDRKAFHLRILYHALSLR